jgi:outer membrane receptor protein involved in Fe transport
MLDVIVRARGLSGMIMLVAASRAHAQSPAQPPARGSHEPLAATGAPGADHTPAAGEAPTSERLPVAIDRLTVTDDLIAAVGLRAIAQRRFEALVATGSDATHRAAVRATDKRGSLGFELTGDLVRSDVLADRSEAAARIEHASEHDHARIYARYASLHVDAERQSFASDANTAEYGAAWTAWRPVGTFELEAYGRAAALDDVRSASTLDLVTATYGARAGFASHRLQALGVDHELGAGITVVQASGSAHEAGSDDASHMPLLPPARLGNHRMLSAYIHDTMRVIESLDLHGGFVFEHWRWLSNMEPLYSPDDKLDMDVDAAEVISQVLLGPKVGVLVRVAPGVALAASGHRRLRAPTWNQLMRPVESGDVRTVASADLRAETVTGGELGPMLSTYRIEARAVAYWNEVDAPIAEVAAGAGLREIANLGHAREAGIAASAHIRIARPLLVAAEYTFASTRITSGNAPPRLAGKPLAAIPRHRAAAFVAFDRPDIVTVAGTVHFASASYTGELATAAVAPYVLVDAMATRELAHGIAGFVAIENLFDRRYTVHDGGVDVAGAPRVVNVGVRLDTARW